jgi:hypothetical protein
MSVHGTNNLDINKNKHGFLRFLVYSTKIEIHIEEFQCLLLYVSCMEVSLFCFSIFLFISSPSTFSIFWTFTTHLIRAILGFILLKRFPDTHQVIDDLNEYENTSIADIENSIIDRYKHILYANESRLKWVLILYFIFTVIDIIVDNVIFFFLLKKWSNIDYRLQNYISLIIIVAFFSN